MPCCSSRYVDYIRSVTKVDGIGTIGRHVKDRNVVAVTTIDNVVSCASDERVIARSTVKHVVSRTSNQEVVAATTGDGIVALPGVNVMRFAFAAGHRSEDIVAVGAKCRNAELVTPCHTRNEIAYVKGDAVSRCNEGGALIVVAADWSSQRSIASLCLETHGKERVLIGSWCRHRRRYRCPPHLT